MSDTSSTCHCHAQTRLTRGGVLLTPYGVASFLSFRESDNMYRMKLAFGEVWIHGDSIEPSGEAEEDDNNSLSNQERGQARKSMELNEAYEALENCRRFNLELTCQECGIREIDHDDCTQCLLAGSIRAKRTSISSSFPRLKRLVEAREKRNKPERCLTCGTPSCIKHSSIAFRREGIIICTDCEKVMDMDFIFDSLSSETEDRREQVRHLIDLYDRTVLLLRYSNQYMDEVIRALEETKKRHNKINMGGSSAGIVSGVLGVAAAFTILTPAGPPLLIASLLFGGGATAVQTGTEVKNRFFFEPAKVCNRVLALHAMLQSILAISGTLKEAAIMDHDIGRTIDESSPVIEQLRKEYVQNREELLATVTPDPDESTSNDTAPASPPRLDPNALVVASPNKDVKNGKMSTASKSRVSIVSRNSRYMSRVGAGVLRTARFARFAGGALAFVSLALEAKSMTSTIQSIHAGSPCEKAKTLKVIQKAIEELPPTPAIEGECGAYLTYMQERGEQPMSSDEAVQLLKLVVGRDDSSSSNSTHSEGQCNSNVVNLYPQMKRTSSCEDPYISAVLTASTTSTSFSSSTSPGMESSTSEILDALGALENPPQDEEEEKHEKDLPKPPMDPRVSELSWRVESVS